MLVLWSAGSIGLLLDHRLRAKTELIRQLVIAGAASAVITLQPAAAKIVPAILLTMSLVSIALLAYVTTKPDQGDALGAEGDADALPQQSLP